jgi:hypothetical protein
MFWLVRRCVGDVRSGDVAYRRGQVELSKVRGKVRYYVVSDSFVRCCVVWCSNGKVGQCRVLSG